MLLGQIVAISVSTCLFLFAMMSHPRTDSRKPRAPVTLWLPVLLALVPIELTPYVVHTNWFLPNLLLLHALLLIPFLPSSLDGPKSPASDSSYVSAGNLYAILSTFAIVSQVTTTYTLSKTYHTFPRFATHIINKLFSHPAISSIGFDAIWVILTLFTWFLSTGTDLTKLCKMGTVAIGGMAVAGIAGMDWKLLVSVIPIGVMAALAGMGLLLHNIRERNTVRQAALLKELGVADIPVESKRGEKKGQKATIAGFWHPYW
jgi:alpha-1,2-mannosyltransferase